MKKTVILGASPDPSRYSYKATAALLKHQHPVVPIGVKEGQIEGVDIIKGTPAITDVHTVTLYINPQRQADYYSYILSLHPSRVIFNPGTENEEFFKRCEENQIEAIEACTLVLLASNQF